MKLKLIFEHIKKISLNFSFALLIAITAENAVDGCVYSACNLILILILKFKLFYAIFLSTQKKLFQFFIHFFELRIDASIPHVPLF